jgi:hypothetical protein
MALGLFIASTALTWFTQTMGYTRDESFYFNYGESYQEWFVAVAEADEPEAMKAAFQRDSVLRTWSGNFEHPPLMKALFGLAWRLGARKYRDISSIDPSPDTLVVRAQVGRAAGLAVGDSVALLAPLMRGQKPDAVERVLAKGLVTARDGDRITTTFNVGPADPQHTAIEDHCQRNATKATPGETAIPITPCQVVGTASRLVFDEAGAMRFFGVISGGLAFMLTFLLGELFFGWLVGLLAAIFFYFVPEHFFHAHQTAFDMPVVAAQLFVLYAFWRGLDDRRWALVTAIAWGIALLIKHNAMFIPVGLVVWWLWSGRDRFAIHRSPGLRIQFPPMPLAFLAMLLIGIPMLFVFWPKLWFDPLRAVKDYFQFHLSHEHYMQYWFGEILQNPPFPFSYPFEKSLLTYPEVFTWFLVVGLALMFPLTAIGTFFKRWRHPTAFERLAIFLAINAFLPILVIALPSTPIFGGIKHWMTGTPFMAIIAAWGVFRLTAMLRFPRLVEMATVALLAAYPVSASIAYAPVGTGHYNSILAGGLPGAADKRLMRLFWGYTTYQALDWLNAHAPRNARVFWQNTTPGSYEMYKRMSLLRHDIRYHHGPGGADIALMDPKQAFFELDQATQRAFDLPTPLQVVAHDGVPFLRIYARKGLLPESAWAPTTWTAIWR